jgi:hypothetical protein
MRPVPWLSSLVVSVFVAACARGGDAGDVPSVSDHGSACARYERVLATCGSAKGDDARRAILRESQGTPEGRALMAARCEQLAGALAAGDECARKLAGAR